MGMIHGSRTMEGWVSGHTLYLNIKFPYFINYILQRRWKSKSQGKENIKNGIQTILHAPINAQVNFRLVSWLERENLGSYIKVEARYSCSQFLEYHLNFLKKSLYHFTSYFDTLLVMW